MVIVKATEVGRQTRGGLTDRRTLAGLKPRVLLPTVGSKSAPTYFSSSKFPSVGALLLMVLPLESRVNFLVGSISENLIKQCRGFQQLESTPSARSIAISVQSLSHSSSKKRAVHPRCCCAPAHIAIASLFWIGFEDGLYSDNDVIFCLCSDCER